MEILDESVPVPLPLLIDDSIKTRVKRQPAPQLDRFYSPNNKYELSIDEAGRGTLFGRVYIACVVLPKDPKLFSGKDIKDSKKFTSKTKLNDAAEYIKANALAWHIAHIEANVVDDVNILQAVMQGMHECIRETMDRINSDVNDYPCPMTDFIAVIDGNYFNPYRAFDPTCQTIRELHHVTVEKGDGKYMAIAAASILAKSERDKYMLDLCAKYPILVERYGMDTNMGYGTKIHLAGIQKYGITQWHRRTFGCCKTANITIVS